MWILLIITITTIVGGTPNYNHCSRLSYDDRFIVCWTLNDSSRTISITCFAKSNGWAAIGFSPLDQGHTHTDIYIALDGRVQDFWSKEEGRPSPDIDFHAPDNVLPNSSFVSHTTSGLMFGFSRLIETLDRFDHPIKEHEFLFLGKYMGVTWAFGKVDNHLDEDHKTWHKHADDHRGFALVNWQTGKVIHPDQPLFWRYLMLPVFVLVSLICFVFFNKVRGEKKI